MFSQIKAWLRSIIAEEVAKVSSTITKERAESIATLKNVEIETIRNFTVVQTAFQKRVQEMVEAEHSAFATHLENTRNELVQAVLQTLTSHRVICPSCNRMVHSFTRTPEGVKCTDCQTGYVSNRWQADEATVAADHALKLVK